MLALAFVISVSAQSSEPNPAEKLRSQDDAARLREARLAFAIQVVSSLADDARNYKDESLRVKVQARAADVLWDVARERARTLFDRAWDAAETADIEGRRQNEDARRRYLSGQGGSGFIPPPPNLRAEVLRLASRHDRTLAERFLAKMDEENKRDDEEHRNKRWDPTQPPEVIAKRLQLASQVLETGEIEKALALAEPGLSLVTSPGIMFLVQLRQTNSTIADQLFLSMLEKTASDPAADATSVSLLSSYLFTPSVLVTSTRSGLLMNPWRAPLPPPNVAPSLRGAFFSNGGQVLLRPLTGSELELTASGLAGTCFTIQRLLPLFQQNAPQTAAALQSKLDALTQGRDEIVPQRQREFINAAFNPKESKEETIDDLAARIEKASSTRERNHLYAIAARNAASRNDAKARELADKIEDAELRKRVRNFVDFILINKALEKKEAEKALQLVRTGELTHLQRAWSFTEVATLLKSATLDRSHDLMNEATSEAERIDANAEGAQAWVAIATRARELDRSREWDAALDVVKAVNKSESYTGEENSFSVEFYSGDSVTQVSVAAPSISIATLFAALAQEDMNQAADIAATIKSESPRAVALLAWARSILDTTRERKGKSELKN
jgi:hypothetical protein